MKSLGNVIKIQYAYIIYPAAMTSYAFKKAYEVREWLHKHSKTKLFSLVDCAHNVTFHKLADEIRGFQKVHGKL